MTIHFPASAASIDLLGGGYFLVYVWSGVLALGACLGSFANVLVYRLPRNLSIVAPRSYCPQCRNPVAWYDNIPLASWLILRGKCRHCAAPIPVRYPLLEGAGALCLALGLLRFGWTVHGLAAGLLLLLLLIIALIDWVHMVIPHTLTIAGAAIGLAAGWKSAPGLPAAVLGMVCGAGVVLLISGSYRLIRGQAGMGGGDVMMMGMLGAFTGPWGVPAVLFAGALLGTLYAVIWGGRVDDGAPKLPFGTFLALGGSIVYFYGPEIFAWYLNIF